MKFREAVARVGRSRPGKPCRMEGTEAYGLAQSRINRKPREHEGIG